MAILMPHCMKYNLDKLEPVYAELLLPIAGPEIYSSTSKEQRAQKTIETVEQMREQLHDLTGLPLRLREKEVKREEFEKIAQTALNDGAMIVNPKKVDIEDVIMILNQAY